MIVFEIDLAKQAIAARPRAYSGRPVVTRVRPKTGATPLARIRVPRIAAGIMV